MRILGLFLKTYDYYEWKDLIAVSTDYNKLKDYLPLKNSKFGYGNAPLVFSDFESQEKKSNEEPHFVIEEVKVL